MKYNYFTVYQVPDIENVGTRSIQEIAMTITQNKL